jgi:serine/threonine-protein kinase
VALPHDDWPRLKEVFAGARALPAERRPAYLAEACADNEALRQEVESLLASNERAESFLETPAAAQVLDAFAAKNLEGQRIGSYQIEAWIGAGGMGEVYKALDTKLNRRVAIKVLLPAVADDPDRLARFSREAHVLASLNHPHIAQIHGLEDAGVRALVMELVEGPTLADRIASAAIPVGEALSIARQIAEALEAAHEQGIIHRDLKPANIKVREDGTVKVLDFGLAKALDSTGSSVVAAGTETAVSPTLSANATDPGLIFGTAAYMSPEQARGKAVDRRADLWAFGCVLYEMLTGRRAFDGESRTGAMAAVVKNEPDWTVLPAETPATVRKMLRRCLENDRTRRLDSAAAARLEIDDALTAPTVETPVRAAAHIRLPLAVVAGAALAAFITWIVVRPGSQTPALSSRFAIVTPPAQPLNVSSNDRDLALSPDGKYLVYRFGGTGTNGGPLMVRAIDQLNARPLADITNAYSPFFSPDSRWIGFFENAELKKVPVVGGPVITLGPVIGGSLGASWADDNTIVFATDDPDTGLWRLSADGGEPAVLTTPDAAQRESDHAFPSVLPDGRGVLFTITAMGRADNAQVAILDLRTGRRETLVRGGGQAEYVEPSTGSGQAPFAGSAQGGYLIYAAAGTLRAIRFDPVRLEVLGDPVTVVQDVLTKASGGANYAVSRPGTLVYIPGAAAATPIRSLVWVDRKGHEEPIAAPLRAYGPPRLSPDGTRVAVPIDDQGNIEVWIWELTRKTLRRLTFSPGVDSMPLWTPDGRRIIYMSGRSGLPSLYSQAVDGNVVGGGTVDRLTMSANPQWPTSITRDGTRLFGFENGPKIVREIILVHLTDPTRPGRSPSPAGPPVQGLFRGNFAEISPDGRYLAYQSDESGRMEVHVRPFPQVDNDRWQISTGGATRPAWARSGRELFYLDESSALTVVPVRTSGTTFVAGPPAKLFDTAYVEPNPARHYDVSPDGQRFLMLKDGAVRDPNATPANMVVVERWFEELKSRAP